MASIDLVEVEYVLKQTHSASLATFHRETKMPYASLVNVAVDDEGPIILISDLAWHTQNLIDQPQGSLLFVETILAETEKPQDPLEGKRVTVLGSFIRTNNKKAREFYLSMHPDANLFEGFSDFSFWRLQPKTIHAIAGFGAITTLKASEIFSPKT